jgi:D-glycero-D-manno-heptose 1,7-bisphosphate phosphatase
VFFDRDGVLNEVMFRDGAPVAPLRAADFRIAAGAPEAVRRLRDAGVPSYVVTNQPDLARGKLAQAEFDRMIAALRAEVPVDDVAWCPHDDADQCHCRKPKPGMLTDLAAKHGVDLVRSAMVGDTWKDMDAGRAAGVRTILLRRPYNGGVRADRVVYSLDDAVTDIL